MRRQLPVKLWYLLGDLEGRHPCFNLINYSKGKKKKNPKHFIILQANLSTQLLEIHPGIKSRVETFLNIKMMLIIILTPHKHSRSTKK